MNYHKKIFYRILFLTITIFTIYATYLGGKEFFGSLGSDAPKKESPALIEQPQTSSKKEQMPSAFRATSTKKEGEEIQTSIKIPYSYPSRGIRIFAVVLIGIFAVVLKLTMSKSSPKTDSSRNTGASQKTAESNHSSPSLPENSQQLQPQYELQPHQQCKNTFDDNYPEYLRIFCRLENKGRKNLN